jgi:hypothetical protein
VQMVSTSTKESSSLEKTLPVTVRLQWRSEHYFVVSCGT